ncbi:MAG: membrane dipeptidase [Myxococcota bacterium]
MRLVLLASLLLVVGCSGARPVTTVPDAQPPLRLGVDTHLHLTMAQAAKPVFHGESGDGRVTMHPRNRLENQVDAAGLRASGVRLVYGAMWPPLNLRPGFSRLDDALEQVRQLHRFTSRRGDFVVVRTAEEARRVLTHGAIAVFPQLEGGEGIESVEDVDRLYAAGVRCITVVHFVSTQLGGAAAGQLSKVLFGSSDDPREPLGLTPLGRDVIGRMMALGIVIDLAHASDAFVKDVLDLTEPAGVPVLVSHTGARALNAMERNLPDDLARRIAAGGGLIGLSAFDAQLAVEEKDFLSPRHQPGTCDDLVAHWKHFAQVVPPTSLVTGTDFNGFVFRPAAGGQCPNGLRHTGDLKDLWPALTAHGVPREALDGMGDALLRLHETVEAKADAKAQAAALRFAPEVRPARSALDEVPGW